MPASIPFDPMASEVRPSGFLALRNDYARTLLSSPNLVETDIYLVKVSVPVERWIKP